MDNSKTMTLNIHTSLPLHYIEDILERPCNSNNSRWPLRTKLDEVDRLRPLQPSPLDWINYTRTFRKGPFTFRRRRFLCFFPLTNWRERGKMTFKFTRSSCRLARPLLHEIINSVCLCSSCGCEPYVCVCSCEDFMVVSGVIFLEIFCRKFLFWGDTKINNLGIWRAIIKSTPNCVLRRSFSLVLGKT